MKQGWEIKRLGDVCETGAGGTPLKTHKDYYEGGTIPWLLSGEVSQGEIFEAKNFITEKGLKNSSAKLFPPNTVLVAMYGATAGQVGILRFEAATNQAVCGILPNDKTIPEYLFYCFLEKKEELVAQAVGGAQPNISQIKIKNTKIPLPPLPEQQRIVSILDEAFAAIAKAKANAELNLKNAKELFESYLQGVFENGNWETKTIQELTKVINGYAFASKDFKPTNTIKSIKITNVGVKEFVEETDNYLPEKFKDTLKEVQVKEGNIVIALTRTIISAGLKVAVVPASYDGALVNQRVAALVPNEKLANQSFLYYFLTTNGVAKYVLAHVNTLMQPNLSINDLKNLPVPCPSIKEQQTVVRQLDALRAESQKLEAVYQKKIDDLEELKKSILQKAFSGQLSESGLAGLKDEQDLKTATV
jgi:type I restriction enzyme S subunit